MEPFEKDLWRKDKENAKNERDKQNPKRLESAWKWVLDTLMEYLKNMWRGLRSRKQTVDQDA